MFTLTVSQFFTSDCDEFTADGVVSTILDQVQILLMETFGTFQAIDERDFTTAFAFGFKETVQVVLEFANPVDPVALAELFAGDESVAIA